MMHLATGKPLPKTIDELYSKTLSSVENAAILYTLTGNELLLLCKMTNASQREIDALAGDIKVTLFVKEYIPFLLFTFEGFYFDVHVSDLSILGDGNGLFICGVEGKDKTIIAQSVAGLPEWMIKKIKNILLNTPYDSVVDLNLRAQYIFDLINRDEMIALGKSEMIVSLNKSTWEPIKLP